MSGEDFQALRNPLLLLLVIILAAGGGVYYSARIKEQSALQLKRQQDQLKEAQTRLQRSGEEKDVIVRNLTPFRQLAQAGIVGDERRLNWVDGLRLAHQQTEIFSVDYQIRARTPYTHAAEFNPGPITINHSVMQLRFRLLHEADLMRFFNLLAAQNLGLFSIDQCLLQRLDTRGIISYQPNLTAECDLSWITVVAPAKPPAPKP